MAKQSVTPARRILLLLALQNTALSSSFTTPPPIPRHARISKPLFAETFPSNNDDSTQPEEKFDALLSDIKLGEATRFLQTKTSSEIRMTPDRIRSIFRTIETRTMDAEENFLPPNVSSGYTVPPSTSKARSEMNQMYTTLSKKGVLKMFGSAKEGNYPARGSTVITPTLLEKITGLNMEALTPKPTSTLLLGGVLLAFSEGIYAAITGVDYGVLATLTVVFGLMDRLLLRGAIFESLLKVVIPSYSQKILRHEAGHFFLAYLLGCPVEGCVLSPFEALSDARFRGSAGLSGGTSFFDEELSRLVNTKGVITRQVVERYSVIVMAGIAAEAVYFGNADGGAGDEMALVSFLSGLSKNDANGNNSGATFGMEMVKNQARWGALQAILLLKEYEVCYEALVKALEKGGGLGECVYAIEKAADDNGLEINRNGVGQIMDVGDFGVWKEIAPGETMEQPVGVRAPTETSPEDTIDSLNKYRESLEGRLKEIDDQLGSWE